jgi:hypothetical protein
MDLNPNGGFPPFTLVTASSEASLVGCQDVGQSDASGGRCWQLIPLGAREIVRIECLFDGPGLPSASIPARVRRTDSDRQVDSTGRPVAETVLPWTGPGPAWVGWDIHLSALSGVKVGHYLRLEIDLPPGLAWVKNQQRDSALPGHCAAPAEASGDGNRIDDVTFCFRVFPPQPCFWATNVLPEAPNGNRFTGTWRSNPADGLPQTLEASWRDPLRVEELLLEFPDSPERPLHYRIEVAAENGPIHIRQIENNCELRPVHRFSPPVLVDQIRLICIASQGAASVSLDRMHLRLSAPTDE